MPNSYAILPLLKNWLSFPRNHQPSVPSQLRDLEGSLSLPPEVFAWPAFVQIIIAAGSLCVQKHVISWRQLVTTLLPISSPQILSTFSSMTVHEKCKVGRQVWWGGPGGEFKREQGEVDMMRTHCTCVLHFQRVLKNNGELSCKIRNMDLDPDKIV